MNATLRVLSPPVGLPPTELHNGDRLTQKEFHELYRRAPKHFKAELIGGSVYVASPVKANHADNQLPAGTLLVLYEAATPGVRASDNASLILDDESEPQPDLHLRLLHEYGGRCTVSSDGYVTGPPELVCEVSDSTRSVDLNARRATYASAGVQEYLVINLRENKVHWFDLKASQELTADPDGIIRVKVFPGLWIDPAAVVARDLRGLLATLDRGLASPEHAAFVAQLAATQSR